MLARGLFALALSITAYAGGAAGAVVDLSGDGKSEIVVRSASGQLRSASLVNNQFQFTALNDPGVNFRLLGIADFNGNGKPDLAYQDLTQGASGDVHIWTDFVPAGDVLLRSVKRTWDVQAVGDLDGDGFADLVWRYVVSDSPDTGVSYIWFTNGSSVTQVRKRGGAPLSWQLLGAVDLNGDGAADMIYLSPDRQIRLLMATANRTCANISAGSLPFGFNALKLGDFTGNHLGEILLRNPDSGQISMLQIDASGLNLPAPTANPDDPNASCTSSTLTARVTQYIFDNASPDWQLYAAGDFNGDGRSDVVWLRPDGTLTLWLMNALGKVPVSATVVNNAGAAPAGFAAQQVTSLSAARSTQLETGSKLINAAAGGTVNLSGNGSSVTIPPGALAADQLVTLSLLSNMNKEPPSGFVKSIGTALSLSFATSQPFLGTHPGQDLQFTLRYGSTLPAGYAGSAPIADIIDDDIFVGPVPINCSSSNSICVTVPIPAVQSWPVTRSIDVASANLAPLIDSAPLPNPGGKSWNGQNWVDNVGPLDPNKKYLLLVHGMASSVEGAYGNNCTLADLGAATCTVENLRIAGGYDAVLGFDYDWTQNISDSGNQLAQFMSQLRAAGLTRLDLEAHSEGGPVALAAACFNNDMVIDNVTLLGAPVMGTPAANPGPYAQAGASTAAQLSSSPLLSTLMGLPLPYSVNTSRRTLTDILSAPFAADLQPGSETLVTVRQCIARKMALANSNLGGTELTCVAGTDATTSNAMLTLGTVLRPAFVLAGLGTAPFDGIIDQPSANCIGAGFDMQRTKALAFPVSHVDLEADKRIIDAVGKLIKLRRTGPVYTLALTTSGSGSGTISANPAGPAYAAGTMVIVSAVPAQGSVFDGWSGACGGASFCTVVMNSDQTVNAKFSLGCTYSVTPTGLSVTAAGGTGSLSVSTQSNCSWTATYSDSWIFAGPGTGTGPGTVAYSALPNSGPQRNGTITIGGQVIPVSQAAGTCTYSISPTSQSFAAAGGGGSTIVTTGAGCTWTAVSNSSFLTSVAPTSSTGSGTVTFSVLANGTTSSRTGTLTIAGQTFTVTEAGTSAPGSTTGTWAGNWNKHYGGFGDGVMSLTWTLVQTGTSVTGTYTTVMLSCDGLCPDPVGFVTNGNLVAGTVSGSTLTIFTEGGTSFNATINGNTMSGTSGGSFPGTFTLTKQ